MREEVIDEARRSARSLHRRFGVEAPEHVQIEAWAQSLGIELVEAPLEGAAAQLVRLRDRVRIVLPERVTDRGARRFSIAHELFHFLKKHPSPTPTMMCTPRAFRGDDTTMHAFEVGANAFSGESLLRSSSSGSDARSRRSASRFRGASRGSSTSPSSPPRSDSPSCRASVAPRSCHREVQ